MNFHSPAAQADLQAYNASMEKSLEDKLFFLDHTAGAMTFVDFGCANGAVLNGIRGRRAAKTLIGIDINPMQLAIASQKVPNGVFVESFELVREHIAKVAPGPKVAIFSSVLHEAPELIREDLMEVFDFIVIRDMAITEAFADTATPDAWVVAACRHGGKAKDAWDSYGTSIGDMEGLTRFLLKAPYLGHSEQQTEREMSENYPMVGLDRVFGATPWAGYAPILFEHYSAPWVVDRIRQDFGFEFPFPTHFKMILKKVTA